MKVESQKIVIDLKIWDLTRNFLRTSFDDNTDEDEYCEEYHQSTCMYSDQDAISKIHGL